MPRDTWVGYTVDGRFHVLRELGAGGMGQVYLARDLAAGGEAVLKTPLRHLLTAELAARFGREIHAAAHVQHPHMVRVLGSGYFDDLPYAVFKYLAGGSLEERQPRKAGQKLPLPLADVLAVLAPLADALDCLHAAGFVHRDIKPANILFDAEGRPKLADFGIVKALAKTPGNTTLTSTGGIIGTPHYMAYEVLFGQAESPASDQFALAVLAYELLTGKLPFTGNTPVALAAAQQKPPPLLSRGALRVPPPLQVPRR